MAAGRQIVAGWLQSGDWKTARAMAACHKYIVLDCEHGAFDLNDVAVCLEVMAGNGCLGLIRVPLDSDTRKAFARRCLDAGAIGILFPNVQTAEEARQNIENCYYPSAAGNSGTRGFGYGGCNVDGAAFREYAAIANSKVVIGVQLEHRRAFEPATLAAILSVPGLCFTQDGPYDHSGSHLVPGETSDPRVMAELKSYREACKRAGIIAGKHVVQPTEAAIRQAAMDGYGFIALGTDMLHLQSGCSGALQTVAAALS